MFRTCLTIALLVFVLDQITKFLLVTAIGYRQIAVMPYINFVLAYNKGAAFGILSSAGGWQRWIFIGIATLISIVIFFWSRRLSKRDNLENIGLGLILGGAWGNLLDRIRLGYVLDFIDFYIGDWHWYTFNVADIAICVGAFLLVVVMFRRG